MTVCGCRVVEHLLDQFTPHIWAESQRGIHLFSMSWSSRPDGAHSSPGQTTADALDSSPWSKIPLG